MSTKQSLTDLIRELESQQAKMKHEERMKRVRKERFQDLKKEWANCLHAREDEIMQIKRSYPFMEIVYPGGDQPDFEFYFDGKENNTPWRLVVSKHKELVFFRCVYEDDYTLIHTLNLDNERSKEEQEDIFNDALVLFFREAFYQKTINDKYPIAKHPSTPSTGRIAPYIEERPF